MSAWEEYPDDYRVGEVEVIIAASRVGDSVAVVGLSGSGKSNLLGFLANRRSTGILPGGVEWPVKFYLTDCNRMLEATPQGFYRLLLRTIQPEVVVPEQVDLSLLETALATAFTVNSRICLLLDRFDTLTSLPSFPQLAGNLRALRDGYKYRLSYVAAMRRPIELHNELAELFFGRILWLGPLAHDDALWSARRDLLRMTGSPCEETALVKCVELSRGYPSLLRAVCEAYVQGAELSPAALAAHPAVQRRVREFWLDSPTEDDLRQSRLSDHPFLQMAGSGEIVQPEQAAAGFDTTSLTAKENLLLEYLQVHPGQVCDKDNLVQAIWPEDVIFEKGVRDESLAQIVRRLRVKIEADPANPKYIHTVPGRGYLYKP